MLTFKPPRPLPPSFRKTSIAIGLCLFAYLCILGPDIDTLSFDSSQAIQSDSNLAPEFKWSRFLNGNSTDLSSIRPSRSDCGGMALMDLYRERNLPSFWILVAHGSGFIIRPQNMELLPCSHLRSAKFSVALENEVSDPKFNFPLGYAIPNQTVPGIYHIYANLKESEYLPPRRYVLSAKLEFGFMFETRTGVIEFGAAQIKDTEKILFNAEVVVWNNDTTPIQGSHTTVIDITELPYQTKQSNLYELCSLHQLSTMRIYRDHQSLNPTECLIPEFTPRNLVAPSPEHNFTPQWLHIVGDSNSHMLFKHLTRHKLSLKQCWSGHYPSPVVCTYPFDGQAPAHGIHFVVYTNWFLDVDVLPFPKNAFHSWDLERFFQEYRHFLPQNEEDPESEYGILMARVKDTYPMPARTIVSFGSHWDHQTPYGMTKTMNAVVHQIENQKERKWYKKTARFVAETAVLTSQIPPKYVGRTYHQQNARIMERNNVVLDICRANGLQFIDQFGWGQAWGVWKEPGDAYHFKEDGWKNGMVYSRMADTYLMDMGFRV